MNDYEDLGEMSISEADDMNVPVNIFLNEPDEDNRKWRLTADNFMPRRDSVSQGAYEVEAETREILFNLVQKHVVPLYEIALNNLKTKGENYYWE